jgi:hypothetical protein
MPEHCTAYPPLKILYSKHLHAKLGQFFKIGIWHTPCWNSWSKGTQVVQMSGRTNIWLHIYHSIQNGSQPNDTKMPMLLLMFNYAECCSVKCLYAVSHGATKVDLNQQKCILAKEWETIKIARLWERSLKCHSPVSAPVLRFKHEKDWSKLARFLSLPGLMDSLLLCSLVECVILALEIGEYHSRGDCQ